MCPLVFKVHTPDCCHAMARSYLVAMGQNESPKSYVPPGRVPLPFPCDLHVGGMRRLFATQRDSGSAHPFATDEADFDPRFVRLDSNNRSDACLHKVDRLDRSIGPFC